MRNLASDTGLKICHGHQYLLVAHMLLMQQQSSVAQPLAAFTRLALPVEKLTSRIWVPAAGAACEAPVSDEAVVRLPAKEAASVPLDIVLDRCHGYAAPGDVAEGQYLKRLTPQDSPACPLCSCDVEDNHLQTQFECCKACPWNN